MVKRPRRWRVGEKRKAEFRRMNERNRPHADGDSSWVGKIWSVVGYATMFR